MVIMHNMAAEYTGRQLDIIGKNKALRSEHLSIRYCSAGKNEMYDQEIIDGAEYLGGNKWYNPNIGGHMVESKETISGTRVIMEYETVLVHPGGTNADGERVNPKYSSQVKSQKTESYSYTVTTTRMEGGHQAAFTVYKPGTLFRVDRAILVSVGV